MHLKKLELQGFKSFPERIRLEFNKGITAVVGPNGSGKSNISDAVRWVLGEQSAKSLRGTKMEDIIFAGTSNRKPLGLAEVSITIDNSDRQMPIDFSEITVTRRLYRSGDSEYLLNGTSCRLKDVHEIFMDTGIGREGYSIIGQGRIDEILSARSEDRRLLFEEAAGIVKFKNRRIEAEAKLSRERQNIIRVEDIIAELETQLEPLLQQSNTAKQYLSYMERLKIVQINIFTKEVSLHQSKIDEMEYNLEILKEQIKNEENNKQVLKDKYESMKISLEALDNKIKNENKEIVELRSQIEQKENDINLSNERIEYIVKDIQRLTKEISQKEESVHQNEESKNLMQMKYSAVQMEIKAKNESLSIFQNDFDSLNQRMSESEQQIDKYNSAIIENLNKMAEIKSNYQKIENTYEQLQARKVQITEEREFYESQENDKDVKFQVLTKSLDEIEQQILEIENEINKAEKNILSCGENERIKNEEKNATSKKLDHNKSRINILNELEKEYEGYNKSVKAILKIKKERPKEFSGIYGAVGELISVPKQLEIAIEISLGASLQNIVTKTDEDAKIAIQYLKQSNSGRATFLPLSAIKGKSIGNTINDLINEQGFIGIAKELIQYENQYENVISSLLGKVIVCDNIDNAAVLHKKYNYSYKIVTLEGDLLNPGGAITGGSIAKKATNIFSRAREIKELGEIIEKLTTDEAELDKILYEIKSEITINKEKLQLNKEVMQNKAVEKATTLQNLEQTKALLEEYKEKLDSIKTEDSQLIEQLLFAEEELRERKETLMKLNQEGEKIREDLAKFQGDMVLDKEVKEEKIKELTDLKVQISGLNENLKAALENIKRVQEEIINDQKEKLKFQTEIEDKQEIKNLTINSISVTENDIQIFKQQQTAKSELINNLEKDKLELALNLSENGKTQTEHLECLALLQNDFNRLEIKKEQILVDIRKLYDTMWDEYEITYNKAKGYETLPLKINQLQSEERSLKNQIKSLGNVNVSAINEYKEKKERFDFLEIQRNDILEAEKKLGELIEELTVLMEQQFLTQLKLISENFNLVFSEMFGGGRASLVLSDDNNVLESGINILAEPPGKKLQIMSLLSGGERALTAIALLFAILKLKPSPFCILDEIEAALDDANVKRYANYLKNFSSDTQFILVTHKKGTMTCADVLYGVTMQEQGISKIVSVQFKDE